MNRFKLFIENFLVYGVGGIISKLIPLIMLPIITRLMPNTFYFGLNDISVTVVSFGSAIAVMGMYDAMFRMFFEKDEEEYQKSICSTALVFTFFTSIIVFLIMIFFKDIFATMFFDDKKYTNLLCLSAISVLIGSTNSIISAPTRMNNNRKIFLVTNTLSPIISYAISIPLLMKGMYVVALPLASISSVLSIELIFALINKKWFSIKKFNLDYLFAMLKIALPLLPNFLVYWVFNSCDRLMISKILGMDYTGIYAIGAKLGMASQLIYTAFAGGWQYFAFSTMRDKDQIEMTSNIFEYLGAISFFTGIVMASCSKTLFTVLFDKEYVQGYIVAPYLFLAPLLLMLFQVLCNQFIIIKKTWPNLLILSTGAICNVLGNYILIPLVGIEGAAISTLMGYSISIVLCIIVLNYMKLVRVKLRFYVTVIFCVIFFIIWRIAIQDELVISLLLSCIVCLIYVWLFKKDIKGLRK